MIYFSCHTRPVGYRDNQVLVYASKLGVIFGVTLPQKGRDKNVILLVVAVFLSVNNISGILVCAGSFLLSPFLLPCLDPNVCTVWHH